MGRVAGVFDNPPGFPCTPPGVDILEGGKLTSNNVVGISHDPLQSPVVASGLTMTLELCVAVQSCVYREYRSGLRMQPCAAPVLRVRGDDVLLPILTT